MVQSIILKGAKKIRFYVMGEEAGAKVNFKAVGNDKVNKGGGGGRNNSSNNNEFHQRTFSQIKTLH